MGPGYIMKIMVWIKNPRHTLVPAVVNPTGGNAPTGPGKNAPLATPLQPIHICCTPPHDRAMRSQFRWWWPTISLTKEILRKNSTITTFQDGSLIEAALTNYFCCHSVWFESWLTGDQNRTCWGLDEQLAQFGAARIWPGEQWWM
jgi:hypothetical protein